MLSPLNQLIACGGTNVSDCGISVGAVFAAGEPVDKLYSCSKAAVVRDAAAKALYARMFQWIISRINTHLQPRDNYSRNKQSAIEDHLNIGIQCFAHRDWNHRRRKLFKFGGGGH